VNSQDCSEMANNSVCNSLQCMTSRSSDSPEAPSEHLSTESNACCGTMEDSFEDHDSLQIVDDGQEPVPSPSSSGYADKFSAVEANDDGKLHPSLQILWSRLRKEGCIVDAAQVKPTRRKLKCFVDRCVYKGGPFDSIQLRCTLPSKVELAIQWICICVSDISRQNDYIIKFINHLRTATGESSPPTLIASREQLISFPFRVCCRHFSTEPGDPGAHIAPMYHLPGKLPISRDELQSKLRRRYLFLSEMGYEDLEIDKLEPNGVLPLPSDGPLSCSVPGCRYKSTDISIFTGRCMKMFTVPVNSVDHGKWRIAIQMGLGLPIPFNFTLPEGAHICEMHFTDGKRYTRGTMKDPSVFRRLITEGINSSLNRLGPLRLGRCAVNNCIYNEEDTVCVPFPKSKDPLYARWVIALSEADESFRYKEGIAVCTRHFSNKESAGLIPALYLGNEAWTDRLGNRSRLKKRFVSVVADNENVVKKSRLVQGVDDSDTSSGATNGVLAKDSGESSCCEENRNILAIVEKMEVESRAVERLVLHLNSMCRSGFAPTDGSLEKKVKFQLFDILSELRSQKLVIHSLDLGSRKPCVMKGINVRN
uniref:THAP-type domain-containing protein n=1 Tax=Haemonchus contortus TaxID=6289 RepID=A0A7I5ED43_HAECO